MKGRWEVWVVPGLAGAMKNRAYPFGRCSARSPLVPG